MRRLMDTIEPRGGLKTTSGAGPYFYAKKDGETEKAYLDFFTDSGTASLGHGCDEHVLALEMSANFSIHALNLFDNELRDEVSEIVCSAVGMDRIFFCNSGTEAIETAIKLARKYQSDRRPKASTTQTKNEIWSVKDSFHGRTYGALAASDGPYYHYKGFEPLPFGYKKFVDLSDIDFELAAAVIISPVFGNNDVRLYDIEYLKELKRRCEESGTLLIFDEIQTGCGRTGDYTYAQSIGVKPNILTLAKGFGMGYPVAATLADDEVAKSLTPGTHFTTFGGSPPALCHVSVMFEWLKHYLDDVVKNSRVIMRDLQDLRMIDGIENVRGVGMFIAFDLIHGGAKEFSRRCLEKRLVIGAFRDNPVKITPPLNITIFDWRKGLDIMKTILADMLCDAEGSF
jgi:acetylornithine/N-succinyldiaminopimelate aminotransferase